MKNHRFYLPALILLAVLLFFVSNHSLKGYLRSQTSLAKELKSPPDSIIQYRIAEQAPFKYRLLFPSVIKGTYYSLYDGNDSDGFYTTYKGWSLLFYISSACVFYFLLATCGFQPGYCFAGSVIFLLLPPMLMAFTLPVHTREDTLGYTLLFLGLIFLVKENRMWFLVTALAAALTRETLLILPLLYLFFSRDPLLLRRLFIAGLPCALWLAVRFLMGHEKYNTWEGLHWNLDNPEQVAGFLFIAFNVCWIPFVIHILFFRSEKSRQAGELSFFYRTALFTLAVILVTTFVGGIYNEIRLLYVLAPWVIIIFLDFIRIYMPVLTSNFKSGRYRLYASGVVALCAVLLYFILQHREKLIVPGKYNVPYEQWIIFSVFYILVVLLFLPVSASVVSSAWRSGSRRQKI